MSTRVDTEAADRKSAEALYSIESGKSCDFDYSALESESPEAALADEISARYSGQTIDGALALKIAKFTTAQQTPENLHEGAYGAVVVEMLRSVLERILSAKKSKLEASCILIALGIRDSNKDSMRGAAAQWGVTPAAVSKRVKELRAAYELPANDFNKSAAAVAVYELTNGQRKKL